MAKMIFVNLPVADVAASTAFYEAIGATRNPQLSQDGAASAMVFSDTITFMLLSHEHFARFAPKAIADAHVANEVLLTMSEESREAVDAIVAKAVAAGGKGDPSPMESMSPAHNGLPRPVTRTERTRGSASHSIAAPSRRAPSGDRAHP